MGASLEVHSGTTVRTDDSRVEVGQWYWVGPKKKRWLGCVTHLGSNYIRVQGVDHGFERIHHDDFHAQCIAEPHPEPYISKKIAEHQRNVNRLLNRIKALCAKLGVTPQALGDGASSATQALAVVHGADNVKAHKKALIKAKEKTLPDLFSRLDEEHEEMAMWMKANLIPLYAQAGGLKEKTSAIEDRIFVVELYAGLVEEVVQLTKGEPAPNDTKVHLYQRRHYMDEECLAHYEAGGMEFRHIEDFDRWLTAPKNRERLLPSERCVVAFQVRRKKKEREGAHFSDFISIMHQEQADRSTFLYIRNGEQTFRLSTEIDFGEELFPDKERSPLLAQGVALWAQISVDDVDDVITEAEYEHREAQLAADQAEYRKDKAAWDKLSEAEQKRRWSDEPRRRFRTSHDEYERVTPKSVYYDDVMKRIAKEATAHNRVAVVLQGLLDRSPALHPHPPWQLWTAAGFASGIHLVYDQTRALTGGDPPDFEAYRAKLNSSIKRGSMVVGHRDAWLRAQADKENAREAGGRYAHHRTHYEPYGNDGPSLVAEVARLGRKGQCSFEWQRQRLRPKWGDTSPVTCRFTCPTKKLLNVDAYTPGDFRIFFADPRTRMDYLKWAPLLLAAEDYYGAKKKKASKRKR